MMSKHIIDRDIQQYVLDSANCELYVIEHMNVCQNCGAKADAYQLLFSQIKRQAKPAFDFDLTELVLSSVKRKEPDVSLARTLIWLFTIIGTSSVVILSYPFGGHIVRLFEGVSSMATYLVVTTATVFLLLEGTEMFRKYKRQIAMLYFH